MKTNCPVVLTLLCSAAALLAQNRAPVALRSPVADKNFYLLGQLSIAARTQIESDAALTRLAREKREALAHAASECELDIPCHTRALEWTNGEIETVAGRMKELSAVLERPLRESGMYQRYQALSGPELLASAWRDAARGINGVIATYGEGKPPRYPEIDSVSFDTKSENYPRLIHTILAVLDDQLGPHELFFTPSLRFAMELLAANNRDEAGRHEPLEAGENRAAFQAIGAIRWAEYPYSAIVVPGAGGDRAGIALSAAGRLRIELAAQRYRDRKAPLILVSGGYVHPNQTPFNEAIEMKRVLIAEFGVPAEAILIDPHARHTTTNMRNAARILYRYGVPFEKTALVTTDQYQSSYIEGAIFAERCRKELGYLPYELGKRISPFDQEFRPTVDSLYSDSSDPLDP
jgi:hypothetical protein